MSRLIHRVAGGRGPHRDPEEDPAAEYGFPPWHTWGAEADFTFQAGSTFAPERQMVRVNYGRPETWTFAFWMKLTNYGANASGTKWFANFRLILGVGRTSVDLPDFAQLQVQVPASGLPTAAFTTITNPQGQNFLNAPAGAVAFLDHFCASDIQISAILTAQGGTTDTASVLVGAVVTPFNTGTNPSASRQ